MATEQRTYLDKEKKKFDSLQDVMKQLSKASEKALSKHAKFQRQWMDIAHSEPDRTLAQSFQMYSSALEASDRAQRESLQHIRTTSQQPLRLYPEKIKSHKRTLSLQRKAKQVLQESLSKVKKLQEQKDQRSVNTAALSTAVAESKQHEEEVQHLGHQLESDLRIYQGEQVDDLKSMLLHLVNAEMHYHAAALDAMCAVVPQLKKVDPTASIKARSIR